MDDYEKERTKLTELMAPIAHDPEDYRVWDGVISGIIEYDGGLNRNSSEIVISKVREVYDRLLFKFPLFFGYWKKYADLEFSISGTEGAEMVYERGIASITTCTSLWAYYAEFKMQTCHDPAIVRELLERGAECCGMDYRADAFWDKWLEFEDRVEAPDQKYLVLVRLAKLPVAQYAKYFEFIRSISHTRPVDELVPAAQLQIYKDQVNSELAFGRTKSEAEKEREIRTLVDAHHVEVCRKTYDEFYKRYRFEETINPIYFVPEPLPLDQLDNWRKYLDFEEQEGHFDRIMFLYERCLTICANYEEFWMRYVRWMMAQPGKDENVRHIFQRASCIFLPVARPRIRILWARFEESTERVDVARDIYQAILYTTPHNIEAVEAWANLERRHVSLDAALDVYRSQVGITSTDLHVKGAIISKAGHLIYKFREVTEARRLFEENVDHYNEVPSFWLGYLRFEMKHASSHPYDLPQRELVKSLHQKIREHGRLPPDSVKELSELYMQFILENGGDEAAEEYMTLDLQVHGSFATNIAIQKVEKTRSLSSKMKEKEVQGRTKSKDTRMTG